QGQPRRDPSRRMLLHHPEARHVKRSNALAWAVTGFEVLHNLLRARIATLRVNLQAPDHDVIDKLRNRRIQLDWRDGSLPGALQQRSDGACGLIRRFADKQLVENNTE